MRRSKFTNNKNDSKNTDAFDYTQEGEIMKRTVSPAFYKNTLLKNFLDDLSGVISHLVDNVKHIRRHFMYSVDPDDDNIE